MKNTIKSAQSNLQQESRSKRLSDFIKLSYAQQASRINAEMLHIKDAINAHFKRYEKELIEGIKRENPNYKFIENLKSLISKLEEVQ